MTDKICFRCRGRKKMYKVGGGYTTTDTGGPEVTCPLCDGEGRIVVPTPEEIKKLEQEANKKDKKKSKETSTED